MNASTFEVFRLKARNLTDVESWILEHFKAKSQNQSLENATLAIRSLGFRKDNSIKTSGWMHAYFKLKLDGNTGYSGEIPSIPGVNIKSIEEKTVDASTTTVNIELLSEDWPFIAAELLYLIRENKNEDSLELEKHLLDKCFSELTAETYFSLIENELVPRDKTGFTDWLLNTGLKNSELHNQISLPAFGLL